MLLPTGQVLFSASSNNVQVYTPDGGPQASWKPKVATVKLTPSANDPFGELTGTQLNGLSQANVYGDDCYPATNYPLVQLRNIASSTVTYCRTFGMSTMGVGTGASPHQSSFSLENVPTGKYELRVVANGFASDPYTLNYAAASQPIVASLSTTISGGMGGPVSPAAAPDLASPSQTASVDQLIMQIKYLNNAVQRLNAIVAGLKPKAPGKDVAKRFESDEVSKAKAKSRTKMSRKAKKKSKQT
jgi:hypothetical protein